LKSPLARLGWEVKLLTRRVLTGRTEADSLREGLEAIAREADEAISAIDELHDLTRLEAGAPLPLQRERTYLSALVGQLVERRNAAGQVRFVVEKSAPDLVVDVDRERICRVLDNLLDNAVKYNRDDQDIHVSIVRLRAEGFEWAAVRVRDAGVGIPARDVPHIFDRYQRGGNVGDIPGEGIGLASVVQLVALHGGRADVDSVEGVGTTFTIRLPLQQT